MRFIYFITSLALVLFAHIAFAASQLPIEVYTKPAQVEVGSLQISPTGEYVSWIVPKDNKSNLVVSNLSKHKITANITLNEGQFVHDSWWVSDDRIVISVAVKKGGRDTPSVTGELLAVNADGSKPVLVFGRGKYSSAFILEPIADQDNNILVGLYGWSKTGELPFATIGRININNGRILSGGWQLPIRYFDEVLIDSQKKARVVSGTTANLESILLYRKSDSNEWVSLNDERTTRRVLHPLGFAGSDTLIYVQVIQSGKLDYLATLNLETGKESVVFSPVNADIGGLQYLANGNDAYAVKHYDDDGRGGYVFLNTTAPEAVLHKQLFAMFPGEMVQITNFSKDGRYASVFVSSDLNPGQYYIYDRIAKTLKKFLTVNPGIKPENAAVVEPFVFNARDGLKIHGWFTMPKATNGKVPLVVLPHGGPYYVVDRWGFNSEAQLLVSRGYAVLQINFRGSSGYGQDFFEAGVREWGGKMQTDLTDGTRAALIKYPINPDKVCIYGASYGAYAALMAVATESALFKCAIGFSGVYDLNLMSKRGDINDFATGRSYLKYILDSDKQWLNARSPTKLAGQIRAPVLLIHGGKDERTPPVHAKEMRKALTEAGNPPDWIFEDSEGHGFFDPKNQLNAYTKIIEFLDANIGK